MTSPSRATYLPRWSNHLTEQLLSYKSSTPSPPPPPPQSKVPSSPPLPPLRRLNNDSGTASVSLNNPNEENEKQKGRAYRHHQADTPFTMKTNQGDQGHDIHQLWSNLAKQLPSSSLDTKKQRTDSGLGIPSTKATAEPKAPPPPPPQSTWAHEEDQFDPHNDDDDDDDRPIGMLLFWFGFLCPLLWWIGSFWPRHADRQGKMAHRWQLINRIMSISFCILLILLLLAIGVWYHFAV
ncbi:hypothetical protein [Absidia glauca]|uniref:Uncharacterized protein n=1 Tax=Absidia glauca TaxID=4829 RepID=A0A163KG10_ABSGL|nr:hypothetical protein [Absidia glauca]